MSESNHSSSPKRALDCIKIELNRTIEDKISYQKRKEQVQTLLAEMFLRLKKRGRPIKSEGEDHGT